jgi:UDP-N-acetylglucosamine/UDP-N-acetylgalactosamine diphosphorylase
MTDINTRAAAIRKTAEAHGQEHVFRFWKDLDTVGREQLITQLEALDWERLDDWIEAYVLASPELEISTDLKPAEYYPAIPETPHQEQLYSEAMSLGRNLLREGRVAGFTVAGGQGTRLGFDGPKGSYPISPIKEKTLFQLFAEGILRTCDKYDVIIPWYIMTSPLNDQATRDFFEANDYFGLDPENVSFFSQGVLPAVDMNGKLLLASPDSLALSPDGHGGSLLALRQSGALDEMRERGIDTISYWQVDNPLVHMFDPLFLGLHDELGSQMSCRALIKTGPYEKLGNFCDVNGRVEIIEYSDMPEELAEARDNDGRLTFRAGSPAIHILNREFVESLTESGRLNLPVHRAHKKVAHVDADGRQFKPEAPNAVKFEMFIFDALPMAQNVLILEAVREEQFGPVKNKSGVDSAESCRTLLVERAARWLDEAGIPVPRKKNGEPDGVVELSPRRFLDPEDVAAAAADLTSPERGAQEYLD